MADSFPTVTVQADRVIAKFKAIPTAVRNRMRTEVSVLTNELADRVRAKLSPGALGTSAQTGLPLFQTTNRLLPAVSARMRDSLKTGVTGRVFVDPAKFPAVAAMSLEYGARAHTITARNAPLLQFFWPKIGGWFSGKTVNHPGFPGAFFLTTSLKEMAPDIKDRLTSAAANEVAQ